MKEDTSLPESVRIKRHTVWNGWVAIKSLDPRGLDKQLREAGWNLQTFESSEKRAFGFEAEARFNRAMRSAIRHAETQQCNCVEFDQMTEGSLLGIPYTSVLVHSRHMQEK